MSGSARRLGINRMTAYGWRDDPEFAFQWANALEIARQGLRERVIETAEYLGVGRWIQAVDPITGKPELDDDFKTVMRFETGHVDAKVLMKLMDKTMRDEVQRIDQRTAVTGHVEQEVEIVFYSPEGEVIDTTPQEVTGGD